jgi:GPH family glycoside/pentoside/hexuronide:cation symporter
MSFIPAAVALLAMFACHFYPLTTERVAEINRQLKETRL